MSNNNRFFMITNNDDCFELKYYVDENKIYSLMKENKRIFIKYIFEDINEIINTDKSISENDKEDLKNILLIYFFKKIKICLIQSKTKF